MAGNVFFNIIPGQRKMVAAVTNKQPIDPQWGASAKLRSVHNNYLTLPVIFLMISNHYPMTYQHPQSWLVLVAIGILSAWARHFFNLRHHGITRPSILITAAIGMLFLAIWVSSPRSPSEALTQLKSSSEATELAVNTQVQKIMQVHCTQCHSATPSDEIFVVAPAGVILDTWPQTVRWAARIYQRVAVTKDMPFLNKSQMTEAERDLISNWYLTEIQKK